MDNIIELIFTLIFGFFWLFGSSLFKNRDNGDEPGQLFPWRRNKEADNNDQESNDSESRKQDIREVIRRKIEERRRQSEPEPKVTPEPEPQYYQQYEAVELQEEVEEPASYIDSAREAVEGAFSWNVENNPYELEMKERLQEIEETKRKAEALKEKVKQFKQDEGESNEQRTNRRGDALFVGSAQTALKNPRTVRAAFVYGEILGKPKGLRRPSETGLGAL